MEATTNPTTNPLTIAEQLRSTTHEFKHYCGHCGTYFLITGEWDEALAELTQIAEDHDHE